MIMDKKFNHEMSFEKDGNWYCRECGKIKDDSEDDCGCIQKNPKKACEK